MDWDAPFRGETHNNYIGIEKMPAPTAGIFDTPTNCGLKINSEWLSFILARLEILSDPRAWLGDVDTTTAAAHEIERLLESLGTEIDCPPPDCPECPPTPAPPELRREGDCIEWHNPETGLWECLLELETPAPAARFSNFGEFCESEEYDNDKMECCDMPGKCGNCVHYDTETKTLYVMDENCNKIEISGAVGNVPPMIGNGEWDGAQPVPDGVGVPPDNPLYKTVDALRCQKATAMVNEMWNVLSIYESIGEISTFSAILAVVSTAFIGYWGAAVAAAVGVVTGMQVTATISAIIGEYGLSEMEGELETIVLNEALKNELICDLVQRMKAPIPILPFTEGILGNHLEAADIRIAIERFEALAAEHDIPTEQTAMPLLNVFPISSWQAVVTSKISETECGCEDFLPYTPPTDGFEPPEEGCFKVYPGILAISAYDGQDYDGDIEYTLDNAKGQQVSPGVFRTTPDGNNGAGSDLFTVGALFEIGEGLTIIKVRFDISSTNDQSDTNVGDMQWTVYDFDTLEANAHLVNDGTIGTGYDAAIEQAISGSWVTRSHILVTAFATAPTGYTNNATIRNISFLVRDALTGNYGWLQGGQELCPVE